MPLILMKIAWIPRRNIEKNWSETKLSEKDATSIPIEKNHMILMIFLNYLIDFLLENHQKIIKKRSQPRDRNFLWNSLQKAPKMPPKCVLKSLNIHKKSYQKSYQILASIFMNFRTLVPPNLPRIFWPGPPSPLQLPPTFRQANPMQLLSCLKACFPSSRADFTSGF